MILLALAVSFFKIGLFSFGGGYAMIPLMQAEIEANGWLDPREFADIVAISQMTPGPIAVNAATYIGYRAAGLAGSISATIGVSLPSLILILIVAHLAAKFRESRGVGAALQGIRPATIGLIASAVVFFSEISIFRRPLGLSTVGAWLSGRAGVALDLELNPGALAIFIVILAGSRLLKIHPIAAVALSGFLGVLIA